MPSSKINFHSDKIDFILKKKQSIRLWLSEAITNEGFRLSELTFIFCSDEALAQINKQFLDHDTYTDIITFDHSEDENLIFGEIYISIDRVKENAQTFNVAFEIELYRVVIHGVLHLCGYYDKNPKEKEQMTSKENQYIASLQLKIL